MIIILTDRNNPVFKPENINMILNKYNDNLILHIYLSIELLKSKIPSKYHKIIDNFNDKGKFHDYMINNDFEKYIPKRLAPEILDKTFPSIVKPKIRMSGKDIVIIKDIDDYNKYKLKTIDKDKYIVQEYIHSFISNRVHLLFKNGEYIHGIVYEIRHTNTYYIDNGRLRNYIRRELTEEEKSVFSQICKKNNYHGLCCIDYTI